MPFKYIIVGDKVIMKRTDKENSVKIIRMPGCVCGVVLKAVQSVQGENGATFAEIRDYLDSGLGIRVPVSNVEIEIALKKAMDAGVIVEKDGLFKLCSRGRKRASLDQMEPNNHEIRF